MSKKNIDQINEIETRWVNVSTEQYCEYCMHSALRHWRRNEGCYDRSRQPGEDRVHWDEDDLTDAFIHSGTDVAFLIKTIDKLLKKNHKIKKRYKRLKIKEDNRKLRKKNKKLRKKNKKLNKKVKKLIFIYVHPDDVNPNPDDVNPNPNDVNPNDVNPNT